VFKFELEVNEGDGCGDHGGEKEEGMTTRVVESVAVRGHEMNGEDKERKDDEAFEGIAISFEGIFTEFGFDTVGFELKEEIGFIGTITDKDIGIIGIHFLFF